AGPSPNSPRSYQIEAAFKARVASEFNKMIDALVAVETTRMPALIPKPENVASLIFLLRGEKVLLSAHLADPLRRLRWRAQSSRQAQHRTVPDDFMFQLTREEAQAVLASRSQAVILKRARTSSTCPTPSPSRAWPCSPACCARSAPSK
ncbi:MAG: ORF6N domain-containing protein, partial [Desulfobacterales bacterium]|nr:ORF6N domain-containing protein [Desulfobacterales bacterium]